MKYSISKNIFCTILLSFPVLLHGAIAYIPAELKQCINEIHTVTSSRNYPSTLQDLYAIIQEGRILMSEEAVYQAVQQALCVIKKNHAQFKNEQRKAIKNYLNHYLDSLNEKHIFLTPHGDNGKTVSWPMSLISRSLLNTQEDNNSAAFDIISLSNDLSSSTENITICGDIIDSTHFISTETRKKSNPGLVFNANMMNSSISTTPNIVFGTGVSSPSINAWIMSQSTLIPSPINIEFSIPSNLKTKHKMSLELHFLVQKHSTLAGNARIKVNAEYMNQNDTFNIFSSSPTFTDINFSPDFIITEPNSSSSLRHVYVTVDLDKSAVLNHQLALFSITRVAPVAGTEYNNSIYLVSASFNYSEKK